MFFPRHVSSTDAPSHRRHLCKKHCTPRFDPYATPQPILRRFPDRYLPTEVTVYDIQFHPPLQWQLKFCILCSHNATVSIRKNPHSCSSCKQRNCKICWQHSKHNLWYMWRRAHPSHPYAYYCLRNPQGTPLHIRPSRSSTKMDSPCLAARDTRFHSLADLEIGHLACHYQ